MQQYGRVFLLGCVATLPLAVSVAYADDNCGKPDHPSTYRREPGDTSDSTRLDLVRRFSGTGTVEINVCNGELRVEPSRNPDQLRVTIASPGADADLARYLQDLKISDTSAVVTIRVPGKYHPVVTIALPSSSRLHSEVNLGAGTLVFHADNIAGDREANVGAGTARVLLDGDRDYAALECNVGMGSMQDDRPGGAHAYGVSSKSMQGKGKGTVEINVGAGKLVLSSGPQ